MCIVEISGWREGLEKVSHTKTLQALAGMSLSDAKEKTDAVLKGGIVVVSLGTHEQANALAKRLTEIGAIASVKNE